MRMRFAFLPTAVALAACLWASDVMAQTVTMPAGAIEESRPPVPAGIGTHGTEDHSGAAQPAAVPALDSAAVLRQRALTAMEILREEIATLAALKNAQAALLAWNRLAWDRGLTGVGEGPATLAAALCAEPALGAWCPLLPATFGTPRMEGGHDRD